VAVIVVIVMVVASAAVVMNPGAVVVRTAHVFPFSPTVAHLPQCGKNRPVRWQRKTRSFGRFPRVLDRILQAGARQGNNVPRAGCGRLGAAEQVTDMSHAAV
jgi:hypothetical protein